MHLFEGLCKNLYWARTCCTSTGRVLRRSPDCTRRGCHYLSVHRRVGVAASCVQHVLAQYRLCKNLYWATKCCTLLAAIPGGRPLGGNDTEAGISPLTVDVAYRLFVQHLVAQYRLCKNPHIRDHASLSHPAEGVSGGVAAFGLFFAPLGRPRRPNRLRLYSSSAGSGTIFCPGAMAR